MIISNAPSLTGVYVPVIGNPGWTNFPREGLVKYSPVIFPSLATKLQWDPRLFLNSPVRYSSADHWALSFCIEKLYYLSFIIIY